MNHYDLSTRHASTLAAITSTFGTVGAILVPVTVGQLTINQVWVGRAFKSNHSMSVKKTNKQKKNTVSSLSSPVNTEILPMLLSP